MSFGGDNDDEKTGELANRDIDLSVSFEYGKLDFWY